MSSGVFDSIMFQNIFTQYIQWHYSDQSRAILRGWRNFLKFNLHYFSILLLLKTLFSPWRRYHWAYGSRFDIKKNLQVLLSNLASRAIGAMIRFFLLAIGIIVEAFIFFIGAVIILGWLILPILLIFGLWHGFRIMFQYV